MTIKDLLKRLKSSRFSVWGRTEVDKDGPWERRRWFGGIGIKFGGGRRRARHSKTAAEDARRKAWIPPKLDPAEGDEEDPLHLRKGNS